MPLALSLFSAASACFMTSVRHISLPMVLGYCFITSVIVSGTYHKGLSGRDVIVPLHSDISCKKALFALDAFWLFSWLITDPKALFFFACGCCARELLPEICSTTVLACASVLKCWSYINILIIFQNDCQKHTLRYSFLGGWRRWVSVDGWMERPTPHFKCHSRLCKTVPLTIIASSVFSAQHFYLQKSPWVRRRGQEKLEKKFP